MLGDVGRIYGLAMEVGGLVVWLPAFLVGGFGVLVLIKSIRRGSGV